MASGLVASPCGGASPSAPAQEAAPCPGHGEDQLLLPFLFVDVNHDVGEEPYGQLELADAEEKPQVSREWEHLQLKQEPEDLPASPGPSEVRRRGGAGEASRAGRRRGGRGGRARVGTAPAVPRLVPAPPTMSAGTRPRRTARHPRTCFCCGPPPHLSSSASRSTTGATPTLPTSPSALRRLTAASDPVGRAINEREENISLQVEDTGDEDMPEASDDKDMPWIAGADGDWPGARTTGRTRKGRWQSWKCPEVLLLEQHTAVIDSGSSSNNCSARGRTSPRNSRHTHRAKHSGPDRYKCPSCDKDYARLWLLQQHELAVHQGRKPHPCAECGRRFTDPSNLRRHTLTHSEARPLACVQCGARFRLLQQLQAHGRTHTGERPYACDACGRRYTDHTTLRRHQLQHTGEVPFVCDTCGKGFARKYRLAEHVQKHLKSFTYAK